MSKKSYYLRLSCLLQKLVRILHIHSQRYYLTQKVSFSEFRVLFFLRSGKPVDMGKIRKELAITGAFATTLVDRLLKNELVERQRDDKDRRKVIVALSDKGKQYLSKLEAYRKRFFITLIVKLKREEKEIMERGLSILVDSLESLSSL